MNASEIAAEIGAQDPADAADQTRYALSKQIDAIQSSLDTGYGPLDLTDDEAGELRDTLRRLLERRLARLEPQR
ncbi:hypothetical protein [Afifella aestuarii]|uniref:hypothetical protein n=1 Tax=Afifella aestuarii TaxID=1909496 RepID=UPI000FE2B33C|nr:hypothetical protein [Afifella aestuarii]